MRFHTVQPISMKLSRNGPYTQGKVDVYLDRKKDQPYRCYRQPLKLTNGVAAFQNVQGIGSEGGRRPSERSYTTLDMIHLPFATLQVLQATFKTDQWDCSISENADSG